MEQYRTIRRFAGVPRIAFSASSFDGAGRAPGKWLTANSSGSRISNRMRSSCFGDLSSQDCSVSVGIWATAGNFARIVFSVVSHRTVLPPLPSCAAALADWHTTPPIHIAIRSINRNSVNSRNWSRCRVKLRIPEVSWYRFAGTGYGSFNSTPMSPDH